jgi:DNA-binding response OmpR family regulator
MGQLPDEPARVLVVEDDELNAALYRDILEAQGYIVDVVQTGADALRALAMRSNRPCFLLLDYELPDMTGRDVLDGLRNLHPHLPVLLVSARDDAPHLARTLHLAAGLTKPIRLADLRAQVAAILAAS